MHPRARFARAAPPDARTRLASRIGPRRALVLGLSAMTCPSYALAAQTELYSVSGDADADHFGSSVVFLGDWDGDGFDEWAGGAPEADVLGAFGGRVKLVSGASGAVIADFDGPASTRLGMALARLPDSNADGADELAMGGGGGPGIVQLVSSIDQSILWTVTWSGGGFGTALAPAGDVDGDSVEDLAVGAPGDETVYLLSGIDGALLTSLPAPDPLCQIDWGRALARADDWDGDGRDDLVIGAPESDCIGVGFAPGQARVVSTATGATVASYDGSRESDRMGSSLATVGDVDGDGVRDTLFGADGYGGIFCTGPGYAELRSGAGGALLLRWTGSCDTELGSAVAGAGDVDLDGWPDVIVGEAGLDRAWIFSGTTGIALGRFEGDVDAGRAVAGDGRVLAAPWPAMLVGAPFAGPDTRGRVSVITQDCLGSAQAYCTGAANSVGPGARISFSGSTSLSRDDFVLRADGCPSSQSGIFFYGPREVDLPFGNGSRCVGGALVRLPLQQTDAGGVAVRPIDYDDLPANGQIEAGETWRFQFWYRDPMGGGARFNTSDALRAHFCP